MSPLLSRDRWQVYVIVNARDTNTGVVTPYYFTAGPGGGTPAGLKAGGLTGGPKPDVIWAPKIHGTPKLHYAMTDSAVVESVGSIEIDNNDRTFDGWYALAFDGQPIEIWISNSDLGEYGDFHRVVDGILEQPEFSATTVILKYESRSAYLTKNIQSLFYGGTGGVDGDSSIAGKPRPLCFGVPRNVRPVLVDGPNLIYEISAPIGAAWHSAVPTVRDGGNVLTAGADYTDLTDLQTNAPAVGGTFRTLQANGTTNGYYIRLHAAPTVDLTCDPSLTSSFGNKKSLLVNQLLQMATGSALDQLNVNSATAIDATGDPTPGVYYADLVTAEAAITEVLRAQGARIAYYANSDHASAYLWMSLGGFVEPSASGLPWTATMDGHRVVSLQRTTTVPPWYPALPVWRVDVDWLKRYVTQTNLVTTASAADRAFYATVSSRSSAQDAAVLTNYPTAGVYSAASASTAITTLASDELTLFKKKRDFLQLRGRLDDDNAAAGATMAQTVGEGLIPGFPLTINTYSRYGCDTSRTFTLLSVDLELTTGMLTALLWD